MSENVAFTVRQAVDALRRDARGYMPGGLDERFRLTTADAWEECAAAMELHGAREVPFIGQQHMNLDAVIVVDGSGRGNALWTAIVAAARAYVIGGPY